MTNSYWTEQLRLKTDSLPGPWQDDVDLTPVWSDQDNSGSPDLLLGNWIWHDPSEVNGALKG